MVGLLLKDIFNLKKYMRQMGIVVLALSFFAFNMRSTPYLVGMMVLMTSMMVTTSMAYDEAAKWDKYALTMPLVKKDIVLEKYVLLGLLTLVGGGIASVLGCFMTIFLKFGNIKETLLACGAIIMVALLFFSFVLPVLFKYGVEKARMLMFIIFGAPTVLIVAFAKLMQKYNIPAPTEAQVKYVMYVSPVIVLLIILMSYRISVGIYEKKEL
jgi:hypothetical protein